MMFLRNDNSIISQGFTDLSCVRKILSGKTVEISVIPLIGCTLFFKNLHTNKTSKQNLFWEGLSSLLGVFLPFDDQHNYLQIVV